MPSLRRVLIVAVVAVLIGACTVGDGEVDHERRRAVDFARTADRALLGTVHEDMEPALIAEAVVTVCRDDGDFDAAVFAAVAAFPTSGTSLEDDLVAVEVVVAGVVEVCPERVVP